MPQVDVADAVGVDDGHGRPLVLLGLLHQADEALGGLHRDVPAVVPGEEDLALQVQEEDGRGRHAGLPGGGVPCDGPLQGCPFFPT